MNRLLRMHSWLPLAAWMAVIFIGSSWPGDEIPGPLSHASVALHIIEYALLYAAAYHAFSRARNIGTRHGFAAAFVTCVLYSVSDEIHQAFVPGRHPDGMDLAVDTLGAVVGVVSIYWWKSIKLV